MVPKACSARVWTLGTIWPPWPKTVGFCDLLGTPYAPVSKIPSVKILEEDIFQAVNDTPPLNYITCISTNL